MLKGMMWAASPPPQLQPRQTRGINHAGGRLAGTTPLPWSNPPSPPQAAFLAAAAMAATLSSLAALRSRPLRRGAGAKEGRKTARMPSAGFGVGGEGGVRGDGGNKKQREHGLQKEVYCPISKGTLCKGTHTVARAPWHGCRQQRTPAEMMGRMMQAAAYSRRRPSARPRSVGRG